jgi:hypothetical protein
VGSVSGSVRAGHLGLSDAQGLGLHPRSDLGLLRLCHFHCRDCRFDPCVEQRRIKGQQKLSFSHGIALIHRQGDDAPGIFRSDRHLLGFDKAGGHHGTRLLRFAVHPQVNQQLRDVCGAIGKQPKADTD